MSESVRELLSQLRISDEPQLSAFLPDQEGQNIILRNLPCALLVREADEGIVLELNDYAQDLFGEQRLALIGKTLKSAGLSLKFSKEEVSASPGKPIQGLLKDSSKASIPVLLLQQRIRINGSKADVIIIIDSTLLNSRTAAPSFDLFKRALTESKTAFIFASIVGSILARDVSVKEYGGDLPEVFKDKIKAGISVSELFSPVNAARIVENAIILSKNGGEKNLELKKCGPLKMFADTFGQLLITFPPESAERKTVRATVNSLSAGMRRTVLYIASSETARNSGKEMLEMIGFHVTDVESPSSARIILEDSPGRFHFMVCEEFTEDPDLFNLINELETAGIGLILVSNESFENKNYQNLVKLPHPLGINLLASAVSKVTL